MTEESQKMSYQIIWMTLFCLQMTASQIEISIQQSPAQIFLASGKTAEIEYASEPSLSILIPSTPEDAELPRVIPLLCLLSDFTPPWSEVLWGTGEEVSEGQMDAGAIDGNGVFSVWSLTTILSETWNKETTCNCTAKESSTGRSISATVSKETDEARKENCSFVLYVGLSCIFILVVIQLLILLFRKCPSRAGRALQTGNQIPMRHIPQTEYAAVRYNK
ncbi:uncharacterized protein LOC123352036 [Mauremys mutica]|uniref:uncharacterized protein LOC123352036 n=1 Tax=Mauremys mutica TaxID=74926 RepID=UPI001D163894|nr:uncharacterized protein LOC123352036 [Mauremys mutica]